MKELSIEEKAKRYDEAIKVAKRNYDTIIQMGEDCTFTKEGIVDTFNHIFPELADNEDEKIRKEILEYFSQFENGELRGVDISHWIAWLEKQGEKTNPYSGVSFEYNGRTWGMCARDGGVEILIDSNPKAFVSVDKTEMYPLILNKTAPKFKVGDWVSNGYGFVMQIVNVQDGHYVYVYEEEELSATIEQMERSCHLWTINDAKDGDVLVASDDSIFLFKCTVDCGCKHYVALTTDNSVEFNKGLEHSWETTRSVHPATKEQYDLLFEKLEESGYEWDVEKKELRKRKIEQKKPVKWSEKDKDHLFGCINYFNGITEFSPYYGDFLWLKSLRDRMNK